MGNTGVRASISFGNTDDNNNKNCTLDMTRFRTLSVDTSSTIDEHYEDIDDYDKGGGVAVVQDDSL
jgi:hypothetical protein